MPMPMRALLLTVAACCLAACGTPVKPVVDAGPDTSCGLDCAAQANFGLILQRCFEYSDSATTASDPAKLGVLVQDVFELEGGTKTIRVEYRQGGQIRQTDFFAFKNGGELWLLRRIAGGSSVTYRTGTEITGVKWLGAEVLAGQNASTSADAFLSAGEITEATTVLVVTDTPTEQEKKSPLQTSDTAVKVVFNESPKDHGVDPRRVFVPGLGFTLIASPFALMPGSPTPYSLQRVRDMGTPDAGSAACSLGTP